MPILYMNQKLRFDVKDDFDILDENEKVAFKVKGKVVSWGDDLTVTDATGTTKLAHIKQSAGSTITAMVGVGHKYFVSKYQGDAENEWATVKKENIPMMPTKKVVATFNDEVGKVTITGGVMAMEFEFKRGDNQIAKVQKKYIALLDRYMIEFPDGEDKLAMACMLLCLDQCFKDDH